MTQLGEASAPHLRGCGLPTKTWNRARDPPTVQGPQLWQRGNFWSASLELDFVTTENPFLRSPPSRPPGPPSIATPTATSFAHAASPTSIGSACAFTAPVFPLLAPPRPQSQWSPARRTPSPSWPRTQSSSVSQMPTRPSRRGERSWVFPTPGRWRASPKVCSKGRTGQSARKKKAPQRRRRGQGGHG